MTILDFLKDRHGKTVTENGQTFRFGRLLLTPSGEIVWRRHTDGIKNLVVLICRVCGSYTWIQTSDVRHYDACLPCRRVESKQRHEARLAKFAAEDKVVVDDLFF